MSHTANARQPFGFFWAALRKNAELDTLLQLTRGNSKQAMAALICRDN